MMSMELKGISTGKCYLGNNGKVWRVVRIWPDGRVQYETRAGYLGRARTWKPGMLDEASFAASVQREVPCDWMPEADGT